jgi:hypothetical protein
MQRYPLTEEDIRQLKSLGISPDNVRTQIGFLKRGVKPVRLNRPCTVGDGIVAIDEKEQEEMATLHDKAARAGRIMKFVPASGAASRMFIDWHSALEKDGFGKKATAEKFTENLHKLAFFQELSETISRHGEDIDALLKEGRIRHILSYILTSQGLNYGHIPKALLKFHNYPDGSRTALEEHLVEAALYTADAQSTCRIHFTVSKEHIKETARFLEKIKDGYEKSLGVTFEIGLSPQHPSSNTVAMEEEGLYRDRSGRLILRPGGHGSLLKNLNDLEGDVIFVKNIDNVIPDRLKPVTVFFKKVLAGYLLSLREKIFYHLRTLTKEGVADNAAHEAEIFCNNKLHMVFPPEFKILSPQQRRDLIINKLNRPLRVCGVVKNEGEPGGGPFWIDEEEEQPLQIIEAYQIDAGRKDQQDIWSAATHFNPVDLVCSIRDYQGDKFDLSMFADPKAVTVSDKIEKGKKIRVLEHPGLWNGAMAHWNTIFVEVPIETFNPVKTINDLLRPQHLAENHQ